MESAAVEPRRRGRAAPPNCRQGGGGIAWQNEATSVISRPRVRIWVPLRRRRLEQGGLSSGLHTGPPTGRRHKSIHDPARGESGEARRKGVFSVFLVFNYDPFKRLRTSPRLEQQLYVLASERLHGSRMPLDFLDERVHSRTAQLIWSRRGSARGNAAAAVAARTRWWQGIWFGVVRKSSEP